MDDRRPTGSGDPFLSCYDPSELRVAKEFLTIWLPFLSAGLCNSCVGPLSDRIRSICPGLESELKSLKLNEAAVTMTTPDIKASNLRCSHGSEGSDNAEVNSVGSPGERPDTSFRRSLKHASFRPFRMALEASVNSECLKPGFGESSGVDMEEEDGFQEEEPRKLDGELMIDDVAVFPSTSKAKISREQREYIRFMNVKRNKEFVFFEKFKGRRVNILDGLELHTGVFSTAEQKRIVEHVKELREKGTRGELRERTYTAPAKWMRGKGRETIQFGCCYNYAADKHGNPPGILYEENVDPLPSLFKSMIKRLIRWHVLPPTCVPDSCIVNIYEEEDCIPPHIDNHDFVRPFCTVSFLSECKILFGTNLKIVGPGEFAGSFALPLPVGSVLVIKRNGADIAKHCVPAVPMTRISITFRRMDESKRPSNYLPDPELLGVKPLPYESNEPVKSSESTPKSQTSRRQHDIEASNGESGSRRSGTLQRAQRDSSIRLRKDSD